MKTDKSAWLVLVSLLMLATNAFAYKILSGHCEYTVEELADPDQVIQLTLSGKKFCPGIFSPEIHNDEQSHPTRALDSLPPYPEEESSGKSSGTFREYKVVESRDIRIEGLDAKEYTVQLLYTVLSGYRHVKGSVGLWGLLPVCEINVVKLFAIKTPKGWYVTESTNIGFSEHIELRSIRRNPSVPSPAKRIAEHQFVSAQCKMHLQ